MNHNELLYFLLGLILGIANGVGLSFVIYDSYIKQNELIQDDTLLSIDVDKNIKFPLLNDDKQILNNNWSIKLDDEINKTIDKIDRDIERIWNDLFEELDNLNNKKRILIACNNIYFDYRPNKNIRHF